MQLRTIIKQLPNRYLYTAVIVALLTPYFIAYFPINMSPDSIYQWQQAHDLSLLDNVHPVTFTLIIRLLTWIWDSPAVVAILNITFFTILFSASLAFFRKLGTPQYLVIAVLIFYSFIPTNGRLLTTFWKDVPYSLALFWYTFIIIKIVSNKDWFLNSKSAPKEIFFATLILMLFRHNGILVGFILLSALFILYQKYRKKILKITGTLLISIASILFLCFGILDANRSWFGMHHMLARHIGTFVVEGKTDSTQNALLEQIQPIEIWHKNYSKYSIEGYIFEPEGPAFIKKADEYKQEINKLFIELSLKHPGTLIKSELQITSLLWRPIPYPDSYSSIYITNPTEKNGFMRKFLDSFSDFSASIKKPFYLRPIFWSASFYHILYLIVALYLIVKKKGNVLVFLPVALNVLSLLISIPAQDFRYAYSSFLISPLIILYLYTLKKEPSTFNNNSN